MPNSLHLHLVSVLLVGAMRPLLRDRRGLRHSEIFETQTRLMSLPRKTRDVVHAGTFQILTVPDQLPVARNLLFGENRT